MDERERWQALYDELRLMDSRGYEALKGDAYAYRNGAVDALRYVLGYDITTPLAIMRILHKR